MPTSLFNTVGLAILDVDYRATACLTLLLLGLLATVMRVRRGHWPAQNDAVKGVLAILGLTSVAPIFSVFLLTSPPAIDRLPSAERLLVGLICSIVLFYTGIGKIISIFWRREVPYAAADARPAAQGENPPSQPGP
jgi:hypothetical protein